MALSHKNAVNDYIVQTENGKLYKALGLRESKLDGDEGKLENKEKKSSWDFFNKTKVSELEQKVSDLEIQVFQKGNQIEKLRESNKKCREETSKYENELKCLKVNHYFTQMMLTEEQKEELFKNKKAFRNELYNIVQHNADVKKSTLTIGGLNLKPLIETVYEHFQDKRKNEMGQEIDNRSDDYLDQGIYTYAGFVIFKNLLD